ncbi:MAG: type III PLP-dependent enzyme, partial [Paracoccaceae bacterium]
MNANVAGLAPADHSFTPSRRAEAYARAHSFDCPTLVLDVDQVADRFHAIRRGLGRAAIHYAVKANPAREVIARLVEEGGRFDAASRAEIELCLSLGARPEHVSFGNTVKKPADIAFAWIAGVSLFAADAEEELEKIAANAPGAEVYIRLI